MQQFDQEATTRNAAHAWLAQFAPLVTAEPDFDEARCRENLRVLDRLRSECKDLQLELLQREDDADLVVTFRHAAGVIDRVEDDLRRCMAKLAPGSPEGRIDLDALKVRLAALEARDELRLHAGKVGATLTLHTRNPKQSPHDVKKRIVEIIGAFATLWICLYAMDAATGHPASFRFYMPSFVVVLAMIITGASRYDRSNGSVDIEIRGRQMTVKQGWFPKTYNLKPGSRAYMGQVTAFRGPTEPVILTTDVNGYDIAIPVSPAPDLQKDLLNKINQYLSSQD